MSTAPHAPASVAIRFYTPRIDSDALVSLAEQASNMEATAPRFTSWLAEVCHAEMERRVNNILGETTDVDLPSIPIARWSNADIAGALTVVTIMSHTPQAVAVAEFLERLVMFITAAASHRLTQGIRR